MDFKEYWHENGAKWEGKEYVLGEDSIRNIAQSAWESSHSNEIARMKAALKQITTANVQHISTARHIAREALGGIL